MPTPSRCQRRHDSSAVNATPTMPTMHRQQCHQHNALSGAMPLPSSPQQRLHRPTLALGVPVPIAPSPSSYHPTLQMYYSMLVAVASWLRSKFILSTTCCWLYSFGGNVILVCGGGCGRYILFAGVRRILFWGTCVVNGLGHFEIDILLVGEDCSVHICGPPTPEHYCKIVLTPQCVAPGLSARMYLLLALCFVELGGLYFFHIISLYYYKSSSLAAFFTAPNAAAVFADSLRRTVRHQHKHKQ